MNKKGDRRNSILYISLYILFIYFAKIVLIVHCTILFYLYFAKKYVIFIYRKIFSFPTQLWKHIIFPKRSCARNYSLFSLDISCFSLQETIKYNDISDRNNDDNGTTVIYGTRYRNISVISFCIIYFNFNIARLYIREPEKHVAWKTGEIARARARSS